MTEFLDAAGLAESLSSVRPVDQLRAGLTRLPYADLSAADLEHLLYLLFDKERSADSPYDAATLMITGADRGRDVWLTKGERPAGLVQCKKSSGIALPEVVREVVKFLLFAHLDLKIRPEAGFVYHLAVAGDPSQTTVDFFDAPQAWIADNISEIEKQLGVVIKQYATFAGIDATAIAPWIIEQLTAMRFALLRPVDLDARLDGALEVKRLFFRHHPVIDARGVIENIRELTEIGVAATEPAGECVENISLQLERASQTLAQWSQDVWGQHLDRPELQKLRQRIDAHPSGATLIIGTAGTGKSALLAELYQALHKNGMIVFAIKADTLDPKIASTHDLAASLGISGSLEAHLLGLAQAAPVVLLIDQLDAVSEVMDQGSERMQVLLGLVAELQGDGESADNRPPIHTVVSSRPFEARFDARFRQLDADEITLSLPPWEKVESLLNSLSIDPVEVPANLRETVRNPFALKLFVDLIKAGASPAELTPFNLLDRWLDRKLPRGADRAPILDFLKQLAADLTAHETLWRPASAYEPAASSVVRAVQAAGLVVREDEKLGFAHQSWLDDFQAKRFTTGAALAQFAWERQDGLFARGTILRGLEHLRRCDGAAYDEALSLLLLEARTRRHLRHLVADFLSSAADPSLKEIGWAEWMVRNDPPLGRRVLGRLADRWPAWRAGLGELLEALMQEDGWQWQVTRLLGREALVDPDHAMRLIDRYWPGPDRDEDAFRAIEQAALYSNAAVERVKTAFLRTSFADWAVGHLVNDLAAAGGTEAAIEIARAWSEEQSPERHTSLSLYDLHKLGERAPLLFANAFLPWFVGLASSLVAEERVAMFPSSQVLPYDWKGEDDSDVVTQVLRVALAEVARTDPEAAASLLEPYHHVACDEVQALIADTYAENGEAFKDRALDFLLADQRRLKLGMDHVEDENDVGHLILGWSSENLIEAIAPFLADDEVDELQRQIEAWEPFEPYIYEVKGPQRLERQRWATQERLDLLARLPQNKLGPRLRRQVREWKAEQPKYKRRGIRSMARFVGSPMSTEQMGKASDADLLRMLDKVDDHYNRMSNSKSFMHGGVMELARAFASLAKSDPSRALAIVRDGLVPGKHEYVAGETIREMAQERLHDAAQLKALIWHLHEKGFDSPGWRRDSASALGSIAQQLGGLEDADIALLRGWFDRDGKAIAERALAHVLNREKDRERNTKADAKPNATLFGRGGGIRILPQWNFTILYAISRGLLQRDKPDHDAWLAELEHHLDFPEDPEVWSGLIVFFSNELWWSNPERTTAFFDHLFDRFPAAFDEPDAAGPLWRLHDRLSAEVTTKLLERWRTHDDPRLRQAAGEFTAALAIVDEDHLKNKESLSVLLQGEDNESKIGALFAIATGWNDKDVKIRARAHGWLIGQAPTLTGNNAHAASTALESRRRLPPDYATRELLAAAAANPHFLAEITGHSVVEALQGLLLHPGFDRLVLSVATAMADQLLDGKGARMMMGDELVSLAVTLQRSPSGIREDAMTLYERLLDGAVHGAEEAAQSALRR